MTRERLDRQTVLLDLDAQSFQRDFQPLASRHPADHIPFYLVSIDQIPGI